MIPRAGYGFREDCGIGHDPEASMSKILIGVVTAAAWFALTYVTHAGLPATL